MKRSLKTEDKNIKLYVSQLQIRNYFNSIECRENDFSSCSTFELNKVRIARKTYKSDTPLELNIDAILFAPQKICDESVQTEFPNFSCKSDIKDLKEITEINKGKTNLKFDSKEKSDILKINFLLKEDSQL